MDEFKATDHPYLFPDVKDYGLNIDSLFKLAVRYYKNCMFIEVNRLVRSKIPDKNLQNLLVAYYYQSCHGRFDETKLEPIGFFNFMGKEQKSLWYSLGEIPIKEAKYQFCKLINENCEDFHKYILMTVKPTERGLLKKNCKNFQLTLPLLKLSDDIQEFKNQDVTKITLSAGNSKIIKFQTPSEDGELYWRIATDYYDLGFQLVFECCLDKINKNKTVTTLLIKPERCNTHQKVHEGRHTYKNYGEYYFMFDNTYSKWRSKNIYFKIDFKNN